MRGLPQRRMTLQSQKEKGGLSGGLSLEREKKKKGQVRRVNAERN